MQNKKGISLIVLVITIIIVIILTAAIMLSVNNQKIVQRADETVEEYNLDEVQILAEVKWSEAYAQGTRKQHELEAYVLQGLEEEKIDLSKYAVTVSKEGVTVTEIGQNYWIIATVDTVPIPKGFVASRATGENTKDGGLVIYEGTEPVTDENVEIAKRTRNQYVWVPVEDFSKFVRQDFSVTGVTISNTLGTDYWEVTLDETTNMPLTTQDANYMTVETLKEVQSMYESIKEYKGFYIARYEAGTDVLITDSNPTQIIYSMMNKLPLGHNDIYKGEFVNYSVAVDIVRNLYPVKNQNYGVVSTLTYGVQWDRTLNWWLEIGARDGKGNLIDSLSNSTNYGNYRLSRISTEDLNVGAKYAVYNSGLGAYQEVIATSTKASGTDWILSTGALKSASINNICDMAGNVEELTMEFAYSNSRSGVTHVRRGGAGAVQWMPDSPRGVADRELPHPFSVDSVVGFRPALYIKK